MSGFQLATDLKDSPNVSSPMAVSPSLLASVAHLTDDVKCEPVVHSRHVDASAPRATMLADLLDEEPNVVPNNVLARSQGFRAKSVREGSSLRPVLLGVDGEDDVRVHDRRASIVKDSALEEWFLIPDSVAVDVFVGLRGLETELVGCNPDHVAVFIMRPPHIKWIVSSRPRSDEPELRRPGSASGLPGQALVSTHLTACCKLWTGISSKRVEADAINGQGQERESCL